MCLTISKEIKPAIADKDYLVYKTMYYEDGKLRSFWQGFNYILGNSYKAKVSRRPNNYSYSPSILEYHKGLHYFTTIREAKQDKRWHGASVKIVECILPKGTYYVEDLEQKLGVCDCLIINKIL